MKPRGFRGALLISITALVLGSVSLIQARGQQSQPQPDQGPTQVVTKNPEFVQKGNDGSPIAVPKYLMCDAGTFLNCHKVAGVTPPKLIHSVDTKYPSKARHLRLEGMSVVKLIVDEKGQPQNVTNVRSFADKLPAEQRELGLKFDENAIKAVKKFRFGPSTLNGKPVPTEITVEENYHLY
jgi:TonB family protein